MKHGEFTHFEIPADDPQRAQRFYEEMFGWSFRAMEQYPNYFLFTTASGQEGMGGAIGKRGESAPAVMRTYVNVDSVDASLTKAQELGATVVKPKAEVPGQGWYAVLRDTEGNEIAVWESARR